MSLCSNAQSTKVGFAKNETPVLSTGYPERAWILREDKEEEEEEDEDVDFNPFLKDTPSQEASSSLSSEVDGLDGDVVSGGLSVSVNIADLASKEQIYAVGGIEHGEEETIMQSTVSPNESCEQELKRNATCDSLKIKSDLLSQSEVETNGEKDCGLSSKIDGNDVRIGELNNSTISQGPNIEIDSEDAICMRTRARYSLAGFSLDELETFLQETDDDDDLQNVDDEEEYRKFLAAVLQGGDGDSVSTHENENVDDEDEDNDADFEIELEELLESDLDENASVKTRRELDGAGRRPETRQNRRQKASTLYEKKSLGQIKRPLRPLLPSLPIRPLAPGNALMPEASLSFQSFASGSGLVNGFTPQQIGQLHSLIHEHAQLLIQVFSLSILDPSRQHIASQVQGLLLELLRKRDEVLPLKSVPYPSICFSPSYIGSSMPDGTAKASLTHCSIESSSLCVAQSAFLPESNVGPSDGRCEYISNRQRSSFQEVEGSSWFPFIRGPILSILDVSPINLVGRYVEDVYSVVQEIRKRYLESTCDTRIEKEPLFPSFPSIPESSCEVSGGVASRAVNTTPTSPDQQQPKKTLAAMLVESTKKQSIALVPKEIARLAQRFLPLFNPALFPHKPPLPAVVNRVLFTDSEDVLLALGLMEYNTDWKAIQQRFLPCKSKHQIFVRQKNRCSSKAPENPIKAVRRMKTSPLTREEVACIQEGLKVYKFDWMSVWKFIVPHRDPSLLPRQWRIAFGTQKSYKQDASKREKRRLYEAKRRKLKSAASESWHATSDKEDCQTEIAGEEIGGTENCIDNSGIAYVHQAFLADWRPDMSTPNCTGRIPSNSIEENHVNDAMPRNDAHYTDQQIGYRVCGKAQSQNRPMLSSLSQHLHTSSNSGGSQHYTSSGMEPRNRVFNMPTTTSKYYYRPYRSRRVNSTHLVKLAPDLPPVNLPPSVRIVSQTAFEGHQCKTSKIYPAGSGVATGRKDNCSNENFGILHSVKGARMQDSVAGSQLETARSGAVRGRAVVAENGTSTDLQMHPLLFQAPESGNAAYYPPKFSSGSSTSFSFFSGTQPQLNLSLFHNSHQQNPVDCSTRSLRSNNSTSRSGGIDFHPLLQKSNDTEFQTGFDASHTESVVNDGVEANGSSSIEKSNDLDLDIHLSSASGAEKSMKSNELQLHEPRTSTKAVAVCGTSTNPQELNAAPCNLLGGKNLAGSSSKLDSCGYSLVVSNENISNCDVDDIGDQSHPGIVMEQEELSDSEEDIEENVEFECEEMVDSEGEDGSGCEQILEGQNKAISTSLEVKENSCELRASSDPQVDDSLPTNNTSTCKIAPTSERNDDKSNSSWLSLDSSTADDPVLSKTKHERAKICEVPTSENVVLSRPSRCSKKTASCSKGVTEERHTKDTVQQLSLGPIAFAAPRKPRKRTGKSNANLNRGLTVESSSHDNNHNDG